MGRDSRKISLSHANSWVLMEACRWPAWVLSLPGRVQETHSGGRSWNQGPCCPGCWVAEVHAGPGNGTSSRSEAAAETKGVFSVVPTWSVQSCGKQHVLSKGQNQDCKGLDRSWERVVSEGVQSLICTEFEKSKDQLLELFPKRSPCWWNCTTFKFYFFTSLLLNFFLQW